MKKSLKSSFNLGFLNHDDPLSRHHLIAHGDTMSALHAIELTLNEEQRDCYQEITNVAMGQAADLLARLLNVYVILPIPNVNLLEVNELQMALSELENSQSVSAVCQGFIGAGISGEALLIFNDASFDDIARLMDFEGEVDDSSEIELLTDVASILNGACLNGIAQQLDVNFSLGHPVVLGQHCSIGDLVKAENKQWKKALAIEINYHIKDYNIDCDLLLLFTEDSLLSLNHRISFLL